MFPESEIFNFGEFQYIKTKNYKTNEKLPLHKTINYRLYLILQLFPTMFVSVPLFNPAQDTTFGFHVSLCPPICDSFSVFPLFLRAGRT